MTARDTTEESRLKILHVASFESDIQTYLALKDVNKEVSLKAKIRANSTAISYNEYILKNSFLWADNVPSDIKSKLEIIE